MLEEVRASCAAAAGKASQVQIEVERLETYGVGGVIADDDPGRVRLGSVEDTVAFVVALDAINFGSGWFPVLRKRAGLSGYHSIASTFREVVGERGTPTAAWLAAVTAAECCELFGQEPSSEAAELMAHFATAWNQLGVTLIERHDGSATALVDSAERSADRLVALLATMPYFDDRRQYRGIDVAFHKRAQITAADLALALDGEGPGCFDDLDRLTIFADNLVPHVLRVDGVLALEPGLAARIDAGELIPEGSEEEVELRACAVHAVELLASRTGLTAATLDNLLWNRGQEPRYKAIPRPRCRTVSY